MKIGKEGTFTATATDPYNDELTYLFDWGDDEYSIIGPIPSGETASASHRWMGQENYEVKVQAFDSFGHWSDWSDPLSVTLSKVKQSNRPMLMQFLENHPQLLPIF